MTIRADGTLTPEQTETMARRFLKRTLDNAETDRRATPMLDEARQQRRHAFALPADDARDALADGETPRYVREAADALLREHGLTVGPDSDGYRALCRAILRSSVEFHEIESRRTVGDYSATPLLSPPGGPQGSPSDRPGECFSTLAARFFEERSPS